MIFAKNELIKSEQRKKLGYNDKKGDAANVSEIITKQNTSEKQKKKMNSKPC